MTKFPVFAALLSTALAACGPVPDHVFFQEPSRAQLSGVWTGVEEITTDEDIASNINFPGTNGFSFPVVIQFDGNGRFILLTSNYPTSYVNDAARSCSGLYTQSNSSIAFFPHEVCRALPMSKYTVGRELSGGISFEARTNTSGSPLANYASVHVRFNLKQ